MINIAFVISHTYVIPSYVAIKSLLDSNTNLPGKEEYITINIIIDNEVTVSDKKIIKDLICKYDRVYCCFKEIENFFHTGYECYGVVHNSYYKMAIPWIFPNVDKMLYIDGDTIIRGDISELYNYNTGDNYLLGVQSPSQVLNKSSKKYIKSTGARPELFINAGILLINCKKQREDNLILKYKKYENYKFRWLDQNIINIVCLNRIGFIPPKYNWIPNEFLKYSMEQIIGTGMFTKKDLEEASKSPVIIHYAGPKPWSNYTFYYREWWKTFEKTPFYCPNEEIRKERILTKMIHVPTIGIAFKVFLSRVKRRLYAYFGIIID